MPHVVFDPAERFNDAPCYENELLSDSTKVDSNATRIGAQRLARKQRRLHAGGGHGAGTDELRGIDCRFVHRVKHAAPKDARAELDLAQ